VKDKKHKEDELHCKKQDKELLLWLMKIFHADPVFAFHVSLLPVILLILLKVFYPTCNAYM